MESAVNKTKDNYTVMFFADIQADKHQIKQVVMQTKKAKSPSYKVAVNIHTQFTKSGIEAIKYYYTVRLTPAAPPLTLQSGLKKEDAKFNTAAKGPTPSAPARIKRDNICSKSGT
ncbi:hypothetical protein CB1_001179012 [Camelus ferus]|nr:hypothetical protein CB1_001179012 [Camelus ferus]